MIIKLARIKRGLTIEQLAQLLEVNKNTLMKYEKGDYGNIRLKTLKKIIEVLDIAPEELLKEI